MEKRLFVFLQAAKLKITNATIRNDIERLAQVVPLTYP